MRSLTGLKVYKMPQAKDALSAREIYEGMTKGEWIVEYGGDGIEEYYGFVGPKHNHAAMIRIDTIGAVEEKPNLEAIATAVNGTYGKKLDPEHCVTMEKALERIKELSDNAKSIDGVIEMFECMVQIGQVATNALSAVQIK
jgi:hypothetical protein